MAWIVRIILFIVAPIAGLFVARDALNFGLFQMIVATVLVTAFVGILSFLTRNVAYCDMNIGTVMEDSIPRVTPPKTNSRARE